jgi:hypothetical protein
LYLPVTSKSINSGGEITAKFEKLQYIPAC